MKYHIYTYGCQMNTADTQRLASELERMGHTATAEDDADNADIVVVNTCVVRQSAEDKAMGRLLRLKMAKQQFPDKVIGVMGCLVGVKDPLDLRQRLPFVDVFLPPSEPANMVTFLQDRGWESEAVAADYEARLQRDQLQDGDLILPVGEANSLISAHVPVVYGCSHACTFCIIPYRRGIERSRSVGEIVAHVRSMALQGVKEVTLLGQIVDRYGKDIDDGPDLADLLRTVHGVAEDYGVERIRFLTSHPNWMTDRLLETVAELPRVMPHIEVPVQAGSDAVLDRMKRGYTQAQYRTLVARIRDIIPQVAINTDIIVGFCGETDAQFMETHDLLRDLKLDKAHVARYSPRPHTVSERRMADDVSDDEKDRRFMLLDALQAEVQAEINGAWLGKTTSVLVEALHKGKWRGRTPQNKLVYFEDQGDWHGKIADVQITWTGPWTMQGRLHTSTHLEADLRLVLTAL
ncbi:MAG: tRNA (N6-isopentenyl adenosine(37)-C2)-methylthiotransferase MiaB [Armatimonadetes bacterium]|nr:tRNA (N6-isopentenyl adenosine(37)-C2)-methylthiotransferase MiaB [Anaerolineae bacterium]